MINRFRERNQKCLSSSAASLAKDPAWKPLPFCEQAGMKDGYPRMTLGPLRQEGQSQPALENFKPQWKQIFMRNIPGAYVPAP